MSDDTTVLRVTAVPTVSDVLFVAPLVLGTFVASFTSVEYAVDDLPFRRLRWFRNEAIALPPGTHVFRQRRYLTRARIEQVRERFVAVPAHQVTELTIPLRREAPTPAGTGGVISFVRPDDYGLKVGSRIRHCAHPEWGTGVIVSWDVEVHDGDREVVATTDFDRAGRRRVNLDREEVDDIDDL